MLALTCFWLLHTALGQGTRIVKLPIEYHCIVDLPSALSFREALHPNLNPKDLTVFTGNTLQSYLKDAAQFSKESIKRFASQTRFNFVHLDDLDYDRSLEFKDVHFTSEWAHVFAAPSLRAVYPDSKYFIWMDERTLVLHPDSHLINHYINKMEAEPTWQMLFVQDSSPVQVNTGIYIFKNSDFSFDALFELVFYGIDAGTSRKAPFERGALHLYMQQLDEPNVIRVVPSRNGKFRLGTTLLDGPGELRTSPFEEGDGFVRFTSDDAGSLIGSMRSAEKNANKWRDARPRFCSYPVAFRRATDGAEISKHTQKLLFKC